MAGFLENRPCVAVTMGDPSGIGPEVVVKGLQDEGLYALCRPFVIGNADHLQKAAARFEPNLCIKAISKLRGARFRPGRLEVLDERRATLAALKPGRAHPEGAAVAWEAIDFAARMALRGEVDAIATAPIQKEGMQAIGFPFPGHTEFFAERANTDDFGMMMVGGGLKILLASIHLPLREAIRQLKQADLLRMIRLSDAVLKQDFGRDQPHIAVAGLNPHASEGGLFGDEEARVISPAIEMAKQEGIKASGPHSADTLFYKLKMGRFDSAIALYHDQALIPIKLLAFGEGVNVTVGLPFIRTSVDHGTAYDIAGQGVANPGSLVAAVKLAARMARQRAQRRS